MKVAYSIASACNLSTLFPRPTTHFLEPLQVRITGFGLRHGEVVFVAELSPCRIFRECHELSHCGIDGHDAVVCEKILVSMHALERRRLPSISVRTVDVDAVASLRAELEANIKVYCASRRIYLRHGMHQVSRESHRFSAPKWTMCCMNAKLAHSIPQPITARLDEVASLQAFALQPPKGHSAKHALRAADDSAQLQKGSR